MPAWHRCAVAEPPGSEANAPLWGVSAEFETPEAMLAAIRALREHDLGRLDAFTPLPVPGLGDALRLPHKSAYPFALGGALLGGAAMMGMCAYATIVSYRFNIGGRPLFSWPAFIVPSFSFAMLTGTLVVVGAMLVRNRLPRLNHPAFNIPHFTRATQDGFFVAVEARDDRFDAARAERVLAGLRAAPRHVSLVPR